MTRLIIQIPCFNEGGTLSETLGDMPTHIDGITSIEILVVDDGSTDETYAVAHRHGVQHIVRHTQNRGLGRAFRTGLDNALRLGADIIVNLDADGQYRGEDIARLIAPLQSGSADIVIGDRQPTRNPEFSKLKRGLQGLGSRAVFVLSGIATPDAVSGFRAISREAALRQVAHHRPIAVVRVIDLELALGLATFGSQPRQRRRDVIVGLAGGLAVVVVIHCEAVRLRRHPCATQMPDSPPPAGRQGEARQGLPLGSTNSGSGHERRWRRAAARG